MAGLLGTRLTRDWSRGDFVPILLLQAVGQAFTMFSLIVIVLSNSAPARATGFSAYIQVMRLGSAEIGTALIFDLAAGSRTGTFELAREICRKWRRSCGEHAEPTVNALGKSWSVNCPGAGAWHVGETRSARGKRAGLHRRLLAGICRRDPGFVASGSYRAANPWPTRASFQERQIVVA